METRHDKLFSQYAKEMQQAKLASEIWWEKLIASDTKKEGSREEAIALVKQRWPLGPASHPYVVAILRKYWLACEKLNQEILESGDDSGDEESVSPIIFLCDYFLDGKHYKLATFIAPLNYWPIGMEDNDDETYV
ncbi:MAG: hypothetical protein ACYSWW_10020 [Planctomycetota bacterium]|jgi:hypothetical protein